MTSDAKSLLQHARWCRISARNATDPDRAHSMRQWARRLEEMAAKRDAQPQPLPADPARPVMEPTSS